MVVKARGRGEKLLELEVGVVVVKVSERRRYQLFEFVHTQSESLAGRRHRLKEQQSRSYFRSRAFMYLQQCIQPVNPVYRLCRIGANLSPATCLLPTEGGQTRDPYFTCFRLLVSILRSQRWHSR